MQQKLIDFFKNDIFAASLGITIEEADGGEAVCKMPRRADLMNANNVIQGGALYTLGDFTFAVAAASTGKTAVTCSVTVNYIKPARGTIFTAKAVPINLGNKLYNYDVAVYDGGTLVCKMCVLGYVTESINI